jgi:hypothetical protein
MSRQLRLRLRSNDVQLAIGLGIVSACLRLPLALTTPFWQDEIASARILDQHSFVGAMRRVVRTESTPPVWYAAAWLVHHAGVPVYEIRLLSVVANFALVALVVLLAARFLPLRFAALTGALVAVGAEFSGQGRWIRAYELFAVLTLLLVFALLHATAEATRGRLAVLAAVAAAVLLTHYFFVFTFAAALAWVVLEPAVRTDRGRLVGAMLSGLVPFAAWSPAFVRQFDHKRYAWIGGFDWREVLETPIRLFTNVGSGLPLVVGSIAWIALCGVGCGSLWKRGAPGRLCATLGVVPLVLAAGVWASGVRVYAVRNLIEIGPFLALAAAAALAALPRPMRTLVPAVVLAGACAGFAWAQVHPGPAYDRVARALVAEGWRRGDDVAVFGNRSEYRSPLEWYLPGNPRLADSVPSLIDEPVFVIGGRRLVGHGLRARRVDNLVVERIPLSRPQLDRRLLRGASVFSS